MMVYNIASIIALSVGGTVAGYLLWKIFKSGLHLVFYVALLILSIALLNKYDLLPSYISQMIEPQRVKETIQEKIENRLRMDQSYQTPIKKTSEQDTAQEPLS